MCHGFLSKYTFRFKVCLDPGYHNSVLVFLGLSLVFQDGQLVVAFLAVRDEVGMDLGLRFQNLGFTV